MRRVAIGSVRWRSTQRPYCRNRAPKQADEYVEVSQMQRGAQFMRRLIEWAAAEV